MDFDGPGKHTVLSRNFYVVTNIKLSAIICCFGDKRTSLSPSMHAIVQVKHVSMYTCEHAVTSREPVDFDGPGKHNCSFS